MAAGRAYTTYPYRVEYPDSDRQGRNCKTLEDALWEARTVHTRWREDNEYGRTNEYVYPESDRAVVTNRNTGYRWIVRRSESRIEFQTPEIFEDVVDDELIHMTLTVEEAEALALAASSHKMKDKRTRALVDQALDELRLLCNQVRERVRGGDELFEWARGIPYKLPDPPQEPPTEEDTETESIEEVTEKAPSEWSVISLKRAAKIIGRAPSTVYKWYREGKFPPAVDLSEWSKYPTFGPRVVVPLSRLEAWQKGERMRSVPLQIFEVHELREPPWTCFSIRKGSPKEDVDYWVERLTMKKALAKDGKRIYGTDLNETKRYELIRPTSLVSNSTIAQAPAARSGQPSRCR